MLSIYSYIHGSRIGLWDMIKKQKNVKEKICFIQWKQNRCYQPANVTCLEHQAIFIIFKILGEIKVGARSWLLI